MTNIKIRNLSDLRKAKFQFQATIRHLHKRVKSGVVRSGRSTKQTELPKSIGEIIHQRFVVLGGFELPPIVREKIKDHSLFDDL
jgi:hypothetical protein